jgi:transposase InsO family protein
METAIIVDLVRTIRHTQRRVGTRKLLAMLRVPLQQHGIKIGRDKLFDLLASCNLLIRKRKRRRPVTTDSNHPFRKYPNMIKELSVRYANQLWVSDITYISLSGGRFCYLSLITDVYSRKIVGHCLYPTLKKEGPLQALRMALSIRDGSVFYKTVHHSDRGLQYCSHDYIKALEDAEISISMTENGNPGENAIAERVNGILKGEFLLDQQFGSYHQAKTAVECAIHTYNQDRLHASRDYLTPDQAYQQASGAITARWKSRKKGAVT